MQPAYEVPEYEDEDAGTVECVCCLCHGHPVEEGKEPPLRKRARQREAKEREAREQEAKERSPLLTSPEVEGQEMI